MNEHAGPACALSGLIVGLFAVLLHDKTAPAPAPIPAAREVPAASPVGEASKPAPPSALRQPRSPTAPSPSPGPIAAELVDVAPPARKDPEIRVAVLGPPRPPAPEASTSPARAEAGREPPKGPRPPSPRPPFAIAGAGESLADVALRIYGSRDAAEDLWKANRDQLERIDSPLPRGTLLRTP